VTFHKVVQITNASFGRGWSKFKELSETPKVAPGETVPGVLFVVASYVMAICEIVCDLAITSADRTSTERECKTLVRVWRTLFFGHDRAANAVRVIECVIFAPLFAIQRLRGPAWVDRRCGGHRDCERKDAPPRAFIGSAKVAPLLQTLEWPQAGARGRCRCSATPCPHHPERRGCTRWGTGWVNVQEAVVLNVEC